MYKIIFGFCFLIFSSVSCAVDNREINGYWTNYYPASNDWGYVFLKNGLFYYLDANSENTTNRYSGSKGTWKIVDGNILLSIKQHIYWDRPWVKGKMGHFVPGVDNKRNYTNTNSDWVVLGSLESFEAAGVQSNEYYKDLYIPESLELKLFKVGRMDEATTRFYQLCKNPLKKCNSARVIINNFKKD